jgi:hypothetical protein
MSSLQWRLQQIAGECMLGAGCLRVQLGKVQRWQDDPHLAEGNEHLTAVSFCAGGPGGSSGGGTLGGLAVPFVRGAHLRSHAARPYTFSNSPVNGLLYVRGTIGKPPTMRKGSCCCTCFSPVNGTHSI